MSVRASQHNRRASYKQNTIKEESSYQSSSNMKLSHRGSGVNDLSIPVFSQSNIEDIKKANNYRRNTTMPTDFSKKAERRFTQYSQIQSSGNKKDSFLKELEEKGKATI